MALDYSKAIRNIIILAALTVLPICLLLVQCCTPSLGGDETSTVVLSTRLWRVRNATDGDGRRLASLFRSFGEKLGNKSRRQRPSSSTSLREASARLITVNIGILNATSRDEADYADLDYKILHQMDIDESESGIYYRRKAILDSRRATTTARPNTSLDEPVNCALVFNADENEIRRVKRKLQRDEPAAGDDEIMRKTENCSSYVAEAGYITRVLSEAEADFPLAFGIRLHDRAVQAEKLLRTIYRPNNIYCIYVDAKSNRSTYEAMRSVASCLPNVFIASKLDRYVYATFSPIKADLQCMRDALARGASWKYFLNLAGSEFPLKTNREIVEILKTLNGSNDIEQYPFPTHYYHRFWWRHLVIGDTLVNTSELKEAFHPNVSLQKGCSYNSFSRPFVEWLFRDEVARRFINWTKDMDSPDELVWATLNHLPNTPGGYDVMVTQVAKTFLSREVIWDSSAAYCHGSKMVRGICILSVGDLQWLSNRWEMFANKFDIYFDHYALDCLEEALRNRTLNPAPDRDINWYGIYAAPHVTAEPTPSRKENIRRHGYI
ncbi:hypothetical protein LSH36_424g02095 [Paralvinella palmiformis]|uniref:Uncharacterized protein n=1 Tax=Paralvinella palmiformis TaxID=53620 RepID=A0AAD9JBU9_9ANNE|nr:hypothetical protein LSH36_424g02095 [Paralvinella palmiformis]